MPAWFVHVDAATIGTGGVQISSPDQGCFLLGHWRNVHILSAVLLPKEAARYAKEGPYAVMQTMLTLPRGAVRRFAFVPLRALALTLRVHPRLFASPPAFRLRVRSAARSSAPRCLRPPRRQAHASRASCSRTGSARRRACTKAR